MVHLVRGARAAFLAALLLSGLASVSARADDFPLGAVAVVALPAGGAGRAADAGELARIREARQAPRLLFAGTLSDGRGPGVRYEFHRAGRFTEPGHDALDMRVLADRLAGTSDAWTFAGWRTPPVFDREHHVLFWAYDVKQPEGRLTLGFAAFCTREGVLLFQRASSNLGAFEGDDAAFRTLLATVRVNEGRRWEDFVTSDPIAAGSLADLVANRGVPVGAGAPGVVSRADAESPGPVAALRERILDLLQKPGVGVGGLVAAVVGLRLLFGIGQALAKRRVRPEEITLPPGSTRKPKSPFDDNRPIE